MVIIANDPPGTGGLNKQIKRREGEEEKGVEWKETEKGVARVCLEGAGRHKRRRRRPPRRRSRRPALRGRMNRGGGGEGRSSEDYTTGHFGHFYERDAQERVFY